MEMNTMAESAPQIVKSYLGQLERALDGVPDEVSHEILEGIAEELSGLDAAAAAERIEKLGDPVFIAAEARAEAGIAVTPGSATAEPAASMPAASGDPRWYVVLASLLVAVGGVVIPVLGWIAGIAMVWLSKTWYRWEKWVATSLPLLFPLLALVGALLARVGVGNLTWWHLSILSLAVMPFVVGIWLLWRALRPGRISPPRLRRGR